MLLPRITCTFVWGNHCNTSLMPHATKNYSAVKNRVWIVLRDIKNVNGRQVQFILYLKISFLILGNHPRQSLDLTLGLPIIYIDRWKYQVCRLFSSCCIGKYYENRIFSVCGNENAEINVIYSESWFWITGQNERKSCVHM